MATNPPTSLSISKNSGSAIQVSSPAPAQVSSSNHESQRRSGGSGSFGAGATTRVGPSPRGNKQQPPRNQTKQARRYRLADEDAFAESAAMKSTSSRKGQTSITHLMNFSLPPRPTHFNQHTSSHRGSRRNPTWGLGSGYHAVDKARYVHANYRFIVDPRGDYSAQSIDADVHLDWNNVLQILASPQSQASACPICLGEPVAPRMAKCGHIFCLPCLIRYMHSTDDTDQHIEKRARWKKCPICWDSIYISETRPVRWYIGQEGAPPHEGEDIVLRLVMRAAGSTLALPKEGYSTVRTDDVPWHFAADVMDYTRVMKGTESYMVDQFDNEISELQQLEKHDELMYGEDSEWTGKAIRAVHEARDRVKGIGNGPEMEAGGARKKPTLSPGVANLYRAEIPIAKSEVEANEVIPEDWASSTSSNQPDHLRNGSTASALSTSLAQFRSQKNNSHVISDYYFYQALLHYFLSPLDIRILRTAFGDFASFPSTILPRVEHVSTGHVVDDDLRKRAKYLAHLPQGCEVNFLECDWTDTVSADVLETFKADIERRRKKNSDKEAREEKERVRAEREEDDKRYAAARRKNPGSPLVDRFQPDEFQPLGGNEGNLTAGSFENVAESTSPMWNAGRANGSGFASLASPGTSPGHSRTVWGTTVIAPVSPSLAALQPDPTPVDDGWLQDWEKDLMREEGIMAQIEAMSFAGESSSMAAAAVAPVKKKKNKKITLMSTNARRAA